MPRATCEVVPVGEASRGRSADGPRRELDLQRRDCDLHHLSVALGDPSAASRLRAMAKALARARHGIHAEDAEDVFQDAVVTYLQIRHRYPPEANHFGLLVNVFEMKSREFVSRTGRRGRGLRRLAARTPRETLEPPAEEMVVRAETARAIRDAIAHLARDPRRVLLQLARGRRRRLDLIRELGINPNTFDSRLHQARARLRHDLEALGAL